ncbi:hypothetical protein BG011_005805 [Mortierella polycephala]|uniref:Galactose oxidase n=1 Tax=Mortierella polycephala TaxID=41804 RepID=A0A9P6PUK4_9FUNG|nr:hypothetical protein BG011_005805 [Mortierella polycephala]
MQRRPRTTTEQVVRGLVLSFALSSLSSSPSTITIFSTTHAQFTSTPIPSSTSLDPDPSASTTPPTPSPSTVAPTSFVSLASAASKSHIYYHGGRLNTKEVTNSNELFSIDITRSWSISSPAWTNLTIPLSGSIMPPMTSRHSATMSKDLTKLYITAPTGDTSAPFLYTYDIQTGAWSAQDAPPAKDAYLLTDTATGAIWYFGGTLNEFETNEIDRFLNGSWNTNIAVRDPLLGGNGSTSLMNKFSHGTAHILGTKIYLFGGFSVTHNVNGINGTKSYQSFQSIPWIDISTGTPTIGNQLTLGPVPPPRQDHCSVLTSSKRVIVFGGYDMNARATLADMWSLDLMTLTWQQIIAVNPMPPRFGHNCNLVGANMIVFGGRSSGYLQVDVGYNKDIQVYDVMKASWQNTYVPKEDLTPPSLPIGAEANDGPGVDRGDSGLSTGGIIGIVLAVVVLVAVILGAVLYRKRRKRIEIREAEVEKEAYLASLASDVGTEVTDSRRESSSNRRQRSHRNNPYQTSAASPRSTSTRHLNSRASTAPHTPGQSHYGGSIGAEPGAEEELLSDGIAEAPGGVQYLMQHLPDGTIAVQPVYLDHQPLQLHHSPNMMYSENSSLKGYVNPPKIPPASAAAIAATGGEATSGAQGSSNPIPREFVPPPSPSPPAPAHSTNQTHGPFASPALANVSSIRTPLSSPSSPLSQYQSSPRLSRR